MVDRVMVGENVDGNLHGQYTPDVNRSRASGCLCRFPSGFSLKNQDELCRREYLNALAFLDVKQVVIAAYDVISLAFHGALNNLIIFRICLNYIKRYGWCN